MSLYTWCERQEGGFWGIVVVLSAFMIQIPSFGTAQSFGIYNMYLLDYFSTESAAAISLVGSINVGVFLGSGPIASFLMNHLSHRKVSLLGALLSSVGLIALPFTPNLIYMYGFYGILAGLGFCLVYVPSHVLSGLYYNKKRGIATGIATSGSGFGAIIFPLLVNWLVEKYGWKGSFYIICGISMQNFVFASLLRPVPGKLLERYRKEEMGASGTEQPVDGTSVKLKSYSKHGDDGSQETNISYDKNRKDDRKKIEITEDDINFEIQPERLEEDSQTEIWEIETPRASDDKQPDSNSLTGQNKEEPSGHTDFKENIKDVSKGPDEVIDGNSDSVTVPNSPAKLLQGQNINENDSSEPNQKCDEISLNAIEEKSIAKKSTIEILCNYTFIIFFLSNIFWNMGLVIVLLFGPAYMTSVGLSQQQASLIFSIGGIGAVIGSVIGGFLGNIEKLRLDLLYIFVVSCVGGVALLFPITYFHTFAGMTALYTIFGVFSNIIMGLLVIVVAAILGPDALGVGMGYVMLANGIGSVAAPPLIGWVFEETGNMELAFFLGGAIILLSGLIIVLIPVLDCFYMEPEKPVDRKKPASIPNECLNIYCM
ncbi:hypothetical protein FSP39_009166 [Pinctada imbricata]|uniref:Major facilitator superfamily (MFS) profile domain-containing protein n=1 Tax=Pinctada imbricata TaxID=66713 RepID=A0AA88Y2Z6_PINIB|nr:hypothetical protein FSP39_009166 [Pinctada imbricata]